MYLFKPPSQQHIQTFIAQQSAFSWSYPQIGATHLHINQVPCHLPRDFVLDHHRIKLGTGLACYCRAKTALAHWDMLTLPWLQVFPVSTPPGENQVAAILAKGPGIWSLNAARIIYLLDTKGGAVERYGFAYGTLPDHAVQGEERFSVEWHRQDDSVWYDLMAFSRPSQRLMRLGYPYVRGLQRRFAADSGRVMLMATRQD
jgi:uncharacterized protein (UPF0548 family)